LRRLPLSQVIADPLPNYTMATAMIAARAFRFTQSRICGLLESSSLAKLKVAASGVPAVLYKISRLADASDDRLARNARLAEAHRALVVGDPDPSVLLAAAKEYRHAHAAWIKKMGPLNSDPHLGQ
jgi:hypothetical protein